MILKIVHGCDICKKEVDENDLFYDDISEAHYDFSSSCLCHECGNRFLEREVCLFRTDNDWLKGFYISIRYRQKNGYKFLGTVIVKNLDLTHGQIYGIISKMNETNKMFYIGENIDLKKAMP
jgi:hypothetical protein